MESLQTKIGVYPRMSDSSLSNASEPTQAHQHQTELEVMGTRLKMLRKSRNYSQRELARRAGLTHTTISAIEAGRIDPALGTLRRILMACDMRMGAFFQPASEEPPTAVVTRGQIATISSGGGHSNHGRPEGRVHMRYIAAHIPERRLEITQEIYEVGADTGEQPLTHEGEEGGIIIRGMFELLLGDKTYTLGPGDSYYFCSTMPHRFRNIGSEEGEIINAASPPTF